MDATAVERLSGVVEQSDTTAVERPPRIEEPSDGNPVERPGRVERYLDLVERVAAVGGAAGVGLIAVVTLVNVTTRTAGFQSLGLLELIASLMLIIAFLPLGAAQAEGQIKMTLLVDRLGRRGKLVCSYVEHVLVLALCALMLWKSTLLTLESIALREGTEGMVSYPLWLIKVCLPVGMLVLTSRVVLQLYQLVALSTGRRRSS